MSPFTGFLTLQGLETLHLRMPRHSENTQKVAEFLEAHEAVEWVNYSGLPSHSHYAAAQQYLPAGGGAILGFGIRGGEEAGKEFIESVKLANIGGAKTLVIHPASTTHSQLTPEEQVKTDVSPEYVRISVEIEDVEHIIADLDQALRATRESGARESSVNQSRSTADIRSAGPLRHAQVWGSDDPLEFENGGWLPQLTVCYETWGSSW